MSRISTGALVIATMLGAIATASLAARLVLDRQAAQARRVIGKPLGEDALEADRIWRQKFEGDPIDLLVLGDSIAAGLGAQRRKETLGARLAIGLAKKAKRPVRLRTAAVVGSESAALHAQVAELAGDYRPDVAVIVVGGNDITHRVPVSTSVRHLVEAVHQLRARGAQVVVGSCPDLGALRPVPQPLRTLGSRMSRQLADAQEQAAVDAGAYAVSLRHAVGPFFISQPDEMFSLDRFHPSPLGYRRTAEALLPAVAGALGYGRMSAATRQPRVEVPV
jgi:lysophospholipase L1-like esterase